MRRLSFVMTLGLGVAAGAGVTLATDLGKHFEPGVLAKSCTPCHSGHGYSGTPMLRAPGDEMCLECHQAGSAAPGRRESLGMGSGAHPADLRLEFSKPIIHRGARCVDCHSVHGVAAIPRGRVDGLNYGRQNPSTKRGYTTEAELCLACHGSRAVSGVDPHDIGLLLDPTNPSYHPVLALSAEDVPSLLPPLTSNSMLNCTDCHTNDDPGLPRGPHGSRIPGLLGAEYTFEEGQPESPSAYALCYACHSREVVLESDPFPYHDEHVVSFRISCVRCHDAHGATSARALILFNEPTSITGVLPSSSGRLEYVSDVAGEGACYLTCHGKDHNPLGYGPSFAEDGKSVLPTESSERPPVRRGIRRVPPRR